MPHATTVPDVNRTAVAIVDATSDVLALVHYYLTAETERSEEQALRYIGKSITDLNAAADAILTGQAHELRRPLEVTEQIEAVEVQ